MARKRRATEEHKAVYSGLEPPWPSAPRRNARYVIHCFNHLNGRRYIVNSYACYAIKKVVDQLLDGQEYERSPLNKHTICFGEIDIKSEQIDEILDHEYTVAEEAFELPAPYPNDIARFLHGVVATATSKTPVAAPKGPRQKIDRTGKTSIQDLCAEIGVEPRDARAALRKAKIEKPPGGWLFTPEQIDDIKKIIKGAKK